MDEDKRETATPPPAKGTKSPPGGKMPPAGPHARRDLTNPDATPGTGSLPDPDDDEMGGISS